MPRLNATARFLNWPDGWPLAHLWLEDAHPVWGGRVLSLRGDGRGQWRGLPPARPARLIPFDLPAEAAFALFHAFIEYDFLTLPPINHLVQPETTLITLRLTNWRGRDHQQQQWDNHTTPEFAALYQRALTAEALALRQPPDHDLPYG